MTVSDDKYLGNHRFAYFRYIAIIVILAITACVYYPIFYSDFIQLDDPLHVTGNIIVKRGLSIDGIKWAFSSFHAGYWIPLTWISHMIDVSLYGLNPGGHHLTNVIIHLFNILLLFFLLVKMTGDFSRSIAVAALFALHPIHVESVAWVAERKDVFSVFWGFLSVLAYVYYVKRGRIFYILSVCCMLLSLMAKPMLVTLPVLLLLIDYWPLQRFKCINRVSCNDNTDKNENSIQYKAGVLKILWEKAPFFGLSLIFSILTITAASDFGAMAPLDEWSIYNRAATALTSYTDYVCKMFLPQNLALPYPLPASIDIPSAVGSFLCILLVIVISVLIRAEAPYFIWGVFWYLFSILPVIGLFQTGLQSMADRFVYIPFIGLYVVVIWGLPELLRTFRYRKIILSLLAVIVFCNLAYTTMKQVSLWKNSYSLFQHAVEAEPENSIAYTLLGDIHLRNQRIEEAIDCYVKSSKINPNYLKPINKIAFVMMAAGKSQEAIDLLLSSMQKFPDNYIGYNYLGFSYFKLGDKEKAVKYFKDALRVKPDFIEARKNLRIAEAMREERQSIEEKPSSRDR